MELQYIIPINDFWFFSFKIWSESGWRSLIFEEILTILISYFSHIRAHVRNIDCQKYFPIILLKRADDIREKNWIFKRFWEIYMNVRTIDNSGIRNPGTRNFILIVSRRAAGQSTSPSICWLDICIGEWIPVCDGTPPVLPNLKEMKYRNLIRPDILDFWWPLSVFWDQLQKQSCRSASHSDNLHNSHHILSSITNVHNKPYLTP